MRDGYWSSCILHCSNVTYGKGVQILEVMNYNNELCHQNSQCNEKINPKKENNALSLQLVYCQTIPLSK